MKNKNMKKTKLKKLLTKNKLTNYKTLPEYLKAVVFIIFLLLSFQSFLLYKENIKFKENLNTLTIENQFLYESMGKSEADKIEEGKKQANLTSQLNSLEKEIEDLKNKPPEIIEKRVEVPVEADNSVYCKELADAFRLTASSSSYDENEVEGLARRIELKCKYEQKPDMVIDVR
jgi:hypothetical protein